MTQITANFMPAVRLTQQISYASASHVSSLNKAQIIENNLTPIKPFFQALSLPYQQNFLMQEFDCWLQSIDFDEDFLTTKQEHSLTLKRSRSEITQSDEIDNALTLDFNKIETETEINQSFINLFFSPNEDKIAVHLNQLKNKIESDFQAKGSSIKCDINQYEPSFIAYPIPFENIKLVATQAYQNTDYAATYVRDGCYARAELSSLELDPTEFNSGKVFVTHSKLFLKHNVYKNVAWSYHVAATAISFEDNILYVIDPCVSKEPITLPNWLSKFVLGETVTLTFTHGKYYLNNNNFKMSEDTAQYRIKKAKADLKQMADLGYSPRKK